MELSKTLTVDRIRIPLQAQTKTELITELVQILSDAGALTNPQAALEAVLKRESERSTGIGYGLAIPHGKSDGASQLAIAAGKPAQPVEYQSLDARPVNFIVLLISPPTATAAHIQALAQISRLMNSEELRNRVAAAQTAEELHSAIAAAERTMR